MATSGLTLIPPSLFQRPHLTHGLSSSGVLPAAGRKRHVVNLPQITSAETVPFIVVPYDVVVVNDQEVFSVQLVLLLDPFVAENIFSYGHDLMLRWGHWGVR